MIALADSGLQVVRLKSGDPMIFGRAGEEIEALRKAGIPYEIVPGVTSALGAAADRRYPADSSSRLLRLRAHYRAPSASSDEAANWSKLAGSGATLVIYMPGQNYAEIAERLRSRASPRDTPCAIVSRATTAGSADHYLRAIG